MPLIQIVLDGQGNAIGLKEIPQNLLQRTFNTGSKAYQYGTSFGTSNINVLLVNAATIRESKALTEAQKEKLISRLIAGQNEDVVVVGPGLPGETVATFFPDEQHQVRDRAPAPKALIKVFVDP